MSAEFTLITGAAGFIGSNFIHYFMEKYPGEKVFHIDKLTYAADLSRISSLNKNGDYKFMQGDVADASLAEWLFSRYNIHGVIHFAAETHVDNSITGPLAFVQTNVLGTFTLLDRARQAWMSGPFSVRPEYAGARFHHVSTDEVYGSLGDTGLFSEKSPYDPRSPYSASKASSDQLVRSYFHTFGMNITISNCSNNYGPNQHSEKLIPTIVSKCLSGAPIPVYGDGKNIRDWLYVLDHCKAIDLVFRHGRWGETYNIGGRNERTNLQIVDSICGILDGAHPRKDGKSYREQISFVKDRPGHDRRYAIDASKIEKELGWKAEETFDTGIVKTVDWYLTRLGKDTQR